MLKLENSYIPFNDFAVGGDLNFQIFKLIFIQTKVFIDLEMK